MARIRTIKPEFFTSEDMAALPMRARLTFAGLWTYVDDYGRGRANPALVKAALWPLDDDVTPAEVQSDLDALAANGQIAFYEVGNRIYLEVLNWERHQRVDRPSKSNIPEPSREAREDDASPRDELSQEGEQGAGNREGERASAGALAEPPEFCPKHPSGTTANCRACGDARRARQAWLRAERSPKPTPIPPRSGEVPAHDHKWVTDGTCTYPGCMERKEVA